MGLLSVTVPLWGGASIVLSYSVDEGVGWNDITSVQTSDDGSYSAVWVPSATGSYLVRAKWLQSSAFDKTVYAVSESVEALSVTDSDGSVIWLITVAGIVAVVGVCLLIYYFRKRKRK